MNQTHHVPEVYNPDVPYEFKCRIVRQLCQVLAEHKRISREELKTYLLEKINVDYETLENNPVGMLLLYEYLYYQRPEACSVMKARSH